MDFATLATLLLYFLASLTIHYTLTKPAAYGFHAGDTLYPVPSGLAWCLFELPNLVIPTLILRSHTERIPYVSGVLIGLFLLHYIHRALIYPLFKPSQSSPFPFHVVLSACVFTSFNASLQTVSLLRTVYPSDFTFPQILCILSFFAGMLLNIRTDYHLLALRARTDLNGRRGMQRPRGGLFEIVVCPNYLGEIIQWVCWALACGTWSAGGFAVHTAGFLAARAIVKKECYRKAGDHGVVHVSAIIPLVL